MLLTISMIGVDKKRRRMVEGKQFRQQHTHHTKQQQTAT